MCFFSSWSGEDTSQMNCPVQLRGPAPLIDQWHNLAKSQVTKIIYTRIRGMIRTYLCITIRTDGIMNVCSFFRIYNFWVLNVNYGFKIWYFSIFSFEFLRKNSLRSSLFLTMPLSLSVALLEIRTSTTCFLPFQLNATWHRLPHSTHNNRCRLRIITAFPDLPLQAPTRLPARDRNVWT